MPWSSRARALVGAGSLLVFLALPCGAQTLTRVTRTDRALPADLGGERLLFAELHRMTPSATCYVTDVALGDVDGDGDPDAFVTCTAQDRLFLNDGAGTFVEGTPRIPAEGSTWIVTRSIALGDIDGDGDLDAVLGRTQNEFNPVATPLYVNDGRATSSPATSRAASSTPWPSPTSTATGTSISCWAASSTSWCRGASPFC